MLNPEALDTDVELENRIADQAIRLHTAPTPDERRTAWQELTRLHALRSAERVAQLELDRGLC